VILILLPSLDCAVSIASFHVIDTDWRRDQRRDNLLLLLLLLLWLGLRGW
jgi:hypothetical protein